MKTLTGKYKPKNLSKYIGDTTNIVYRSSWERKAMLYFDTNPNIITWQSEELFIRYFDPSSNKIRRYFPDFLIEARMKNGEVKKILIEIKPHKQTMEPKKKSRITKQYITEVLTWTTNDAKWKAAQEYCNSLGWEFKILTEHELGIHK